VRIQAVARGRKARKSITRDDAGVLHLLTAGTPPLEAAPARIKKKAGAGKKASSAGVGAGSSNPGRAKSTSSPGKKKSSLNSNLPVASPRMAPIKASDEEVKKALTILGYGVRFLTVKWDHWSQVSGFRWTHRSADGSTAAP
jgi:hypothetical protein